MFEGRNPIEEDISMICLVMFGCPALVFEEELELVCEEDFEFSVGWGLSVIPLGFLCPELVNGVDMSSCKCCKGTLHDKFWGVWGPVHPDHQ